MQVWEKINSKWSDEEIRSKLTELGFLGDEKVNTTNKDIHTMIDDVKKENRKKKKKKDKPEIEKMNHKL